MNLIKSGPVQPLYIEDWTPYYSRDDLDLYGYPENWGVNDYGVVDGQPIMELQWGNVTYKKIHRYDRIERFKTTMYHLLGINGRVKWQIIKTIRKIGFDKNPDRVWDSIRKILKETGNTKYYNRIPSILAIMQYDKVIDWGNDMELVLTCIREFYRMSENFDAANGKYGTYFPNLRFTALRVMMMNGVVFEYYIPLFRTKRKIDPAIDIFNELY